jgi:LMBR1 domain-containing protein 1
MSVLQTSLIWIAYAVAAGVSLVAASLTTYTWQASRDRSALVSVVTTISLTALLATVLLLPVDAALVSATASTRLGVKHDWATSEHVTSLLNTLRIVYYSLYSFDALACLIIIPWSYFWYEEYDEIEVEEEGRSVLSRAWAAMRYTIFFVLLVVIVFLLGFFVPAAGDANRDHWDLDYYKRLLIENSGEKALTFALGLLVTLGTLVYVIYTGAGLALLPVSFVKSAPSISAPQLSATTASALESNRERQRQLEMRSAGNELPQKDRRELDDLQREELTLVRRERLAAEAMGEGRGKLYKAWLKLCAVLRPVKMIGGVLLALVALLVWTSMLITGIDKAKNSICKAHCGYILGHINVFQPVNWIFMQTARAFPADYVLMAVLVILMFAGTVSGIATVGIRFLWVRIFSIRKGRTPPQAMLIATVLLALAILAINYAIAMMVAPQYSTYGTQRFCTRQPAYAGARPDCTDFPELVVPCSEELGHDYPAAADTCTPTVMSTILNRMSITWPFFGVVDFWAQFAFLGMFLVVFATAMVRAPRLNLAEIDEEIEADEEEGLLASTGRRFGATWQDITGQPGRANGSQ